MAVGCAFKPLPSGSLEDSRIRGVEDSSVTKESIIKKTYTSKNLPSPLFAKEG
jgi:hypothetical protein